uniref:Signal induced proliferation associated 1 like 3 n=1 Tax=Pelodiscus sinensis TaxID=13735 RepID=K7GCQ5_PELSI
GSPSSIDVQGISEQSFFDILREFRGQQPAQEGAALENPGDSSLHLAGTAAEVRNGHGLPPEDCPTQPREKPRKKGPKAEAGGESLFRKLRSGRSDGEPGKAAAEPGEGARAWVCQKSFAHYDVQSMLFDLSQVAASRAVVAQRRNTTTGASAASAVSAALSRAYGLGGLDPAFASTEDLNSKENLEHDLGDNKSNDLLLSCPHFRNEVGGMCERSVSFSAGEGGFLEPSLNAYCTNASISVLEVPRELQRSPGKLTRYNVEHVDLGAHYYQQYFHGKELGRFSGPGDPVSPVPAGSCQGRCQRCEAGPQRALGAVTRPLERLVTLRGSILEDAIPSTAKHGTLRGLPLKDVLSNPRPCAWVQLVTLRGCRREGGQALTAVPAPQLCRKHKVGILYCKAGQSSEEEMYNNEEAGPAFEEFLALLGEKVCLKAFGKYAAQLDTKTDSTGTHSLYTTYQDYEIMFHVSTMLPYTLNNRQQLLRKRHIGNDIVTIIFQEPGALPFTPQNIRSHFQHVFIVVRAHSPCTDNVCYSVAVSRSKDAPPFGPPIPSGVTFRKSDVFRDFLLAKVINAENAAHKSDKFHTMATRTRQEYLKDLAENCSTSTPIDSTGKFNLISLASKRKEKGKARPGAEQHSTGAIAWRVAAQDFAQGAEVECVLGISNEFLVLLDLRTKEVVFNCFCGDVIGWTPEALALKVFYGRGDHVFIRAVDGSPEAIQEIVQRLKVGAELVRVGLSWPGAPGRGVLRRFRGTVCGSWRCHSYSCAWAEGRVQGAEPAETGRLAVVTLSHDQMIDLLRTSVTVKVVIIPPHEDGVPRRYPGFGHRLRQRSQPRLLPNPSPAVGRAPHRSGGPWTWLARPVSGARSHWGQPRVSWGLPALGRQRYWEQQRGLAAWLSRPAPQHPPAVLLFSTAQCGPSTRPVSFPETPHAAPAGPERAQPYRQPSGSFSTPGSGGTAYARYKPSPER